MPCQHVGNAIVCTRKERKRRCSVKVNGTRCSNFEERTCDAPGCDKPLCLDHAVHVNGKNIDYCPTHPEVIAALKGRAA
jgi:hypothetical protein